MHILKILKLTMTDDGAGAKFSNRPFSTSSANKWPWWPLVSTVICRSKWILLNVKISRGNHDHLLAPEAKNGHFVKTASAPFLVIFYESWVISIMTHTFLFALKLILFKHIWIINLWLMSREKISENGVETKFQDLPFSASGANKWPQWVLETIIIEESIKN